MSGVERPVSGIPNMIYRWALLACLLAVFVDTGCTTGVSVKGGESEKRWICDQAGDEAMEREDYATGILLHQRLLDKEPENALALYHLGYAYGQTGNHQQEVSYYKEAVALGYEEESLFFNMGMAYGELNEVDNAIDAFEKAVDINPDSAESHFGLAMTYQKSAVDDLAEAEFLKAIRIDSGHVDARLLLSLLYADWGELQKAIEQLRKILEIDPNHVRAREFLKRIEKE